MTISVIYSDTSGTSLDELYSRGERERAPHMLVEVVRAYVRAVLVSRIPYVQIIHLLIIILN